MCSAVFLKTVFLEKQFYVFHGAEYYLKVVNAKICLLQEKLCTKPIWEKKEEEENYRIADIIRPSPFLPKWDEA